MGVMDEDKVAAEIIEKQLAAFSDADLGQLFRSLLIKDCSKVLPWLERADLLLTDPPYGMDYQSNLRESQLKKIENDTDLSKVSELVNQAILKLN